MKKRLFRRRKTHKRSPSRRETISPNATQHDSVAPTEDFDLSNPEVVLQLQQLHGNQFVNRLIQRATPDDTTEAYTHTQKSADQYALKEAVEMLEAINRGAILGMGYYQSRVIPNYIGRKIWYVGLKDLSASQRLQHLQSAYQQLQPLVKRHRQYSNFLPNRFQSSATECRIQLEKKAADEKIIKREEELKGASFGLGTLSEDKMRLQLIATAKEAEGVFKQVKDVSDKVLSYTDKALGVGKDLAETESNPIDSLVKKHLAGEDVSKETQALVTAKTAEDLTETTDDNIRKPRLDGKKTAQNISDAMIALKGIGYALQIADVVQREKALQAILDEYPHPVAKTSNVAGKIFEVMQYGTDVSEVVLRRVAQVKGGDALKQVSKHLDMLGKASKVLGAASSTLFLIRDVTVLLDDDSTDKQKSEATFSAATNTASLGLLIAGAKGSTYANPLGLSLFLTQIMLEQAGEHVFWKSNQALISGFSKKIFGFIDDGASYLSSASSKLQATNEVMLAGRNEDPESRDTDPWEDDMVDSHISEDDVRSKLKHLDMRMRHFVDLVLNPQCSMIPQSLAMYRPGGYGVIREYFEDFDYLQQSVDFDSMSGEELQEYVEEHLDSAFDLIKTYRMFRMQKGDIAKVLGTRYEGDRDALSEDVMKDKAKLSEAFA